MQQNFEQAGAGFTPYQAPVFKASQIRRMARAKLRGKWKKVFVPVFIYSLFIILPFLIYYGLYTSEYYGAELLTDPDIAVSYDDYINLIDESQQAISPMLNTLGGVLEIYFLLVSGAFGVGMAIISLKIIRDEEVTASDAFSGFRKYGQSFCTGFLVLFFSMLWSLLFMLPGSVLMLAGIVMYAASLSGASILMLLAGIAALLGAAVCLIIFLMRYRMTYFIAADNRGMRATAAVFSSVLMLRGRLTRLFCLLLSFTGWLILVSIPLALAYVILTLTDAFVGCLIASLLMIAGIAAYAPLLLYMRASEAVFYSTLTGNFRPAQTAEPAAEDSSFWNPPDYL